MPEGAEGFEPERLCAGSAVSVAEPSREHRDAAVEAVTIPEHESHLVCGLFSEFLHSVGYGNLDEPDEVEMTRAVLKDGFAYLLKTEGPPGNQWLVLLVSADSFTTFVETRVHPGPFGTMFARAVEAAHSRFVETPDGWRLAP